MATITDIVISWLNEWGKVFYIDLLIIEPKIEESERGMMHSPGFKAAMTKRGRLYQAYIEKQISKLDTKYAVNDRKGRFEITPIGEKKQEENIDPKVQKKHKGKSAPFGSAYEKVKESTKFARGKVDTRYRSIEKRGDKYYYTQDDPLGQGIRQEFGPYKTKAAA